MNKLDPHILGWTNWPELKNFVRRTQPRIIKLVGPSAHDTLKIAELKRLSPASLWLYRHYVDQQPLDSPTKNARNFSELLKPYLNWYDIFEGYNEPWPFEEDQWKRINEFETELARIIHGWDKQYCALNWSNGQPPDIAWKFMRDCLEQTDYISLHSYGWPTLKDSQDFTLRHCRIYDGVLPIRKPLILSEVGMTAAVYHGPDLGWQHWSWPYSLERKAARAAEQWAWFLDEINRDRYVVAANMYTTGRLRGDNWGTHDFTPRLYKLVGDYIVGHPSPSDEGDGSYDEGDGSSGVWKNVPPEIAQWRPLIEKITSSFHVPIPPHNGVHLSPAKVLAVIIRRESEGKRMATNPETGAAGLCQIMPFHFEPGQDPYEPEWNIRKGLSILQEKLYPKNAPPREFQTALFYYGGKADRPWEPFIEKYWNPFVEWYRDFWGVDLEPSSPIDYKKKYEDLRYTMTTIRDRADAALDD